MDIQKRIENHWQRADHRYSDYIQGELNSFKREVREISPKHWVLVIGFNNII